VRETHPRPPWGVLAGRRRDQPCAACGAPRAGLVLSAYPGRADLIVIGDGRLVSAGPARDAYRVIVDLNTGVVWFSPNHYTDFYKI